MPAGRPSFKPTAAQRRKVEELRSVGMSKDDVAAVLGVTRPTLDKHFEVELQVGAAKKRAEVVSFLYKSARGGNVSAQKKLEEMTRVTLAEEANTRIDSRQASPSSKLGKKATQELEAQTAGQGTPWGDDLVFKTPDTKTIQ